MKIKILELTPGCMPEIFDNGDWIDLITAEDTNLITPYVQVDVNCLPRIGQVSFNTALIPLGIAVEIPQGFEAHIVPRSSTFKKWGIIQTNSVGIIDCTYCGPNDQWKMPVLATRSVTIPKGTRIAQFRVQLSQKATSEQKKAWLEDGTLELEQVDHLDNPDRKGFGEGTKNK